MVFRSWLNPNIFMIFPKLEICLQNLWCLKICPEYLSMIHLIIPSEVKFILILQNLHAYCSVILLFAKERFREEYSSEWAKGTRILKDTFYSILRTMYRNKFGANFIRVVVIGFSKYSTGELVVTTAVLLRPHPDNYGDLLQLWSDQVSWGGPSQSNISMPGQDVCSGKI